MRPPSFRLGSIVRPLAAALVLAPQAEAQYGQGNGFLFREPVGSFALRAGFAQAQAGSDIFSFVTDELTLGRSDFAGLSYAASLSVRLQPRLDLELGGSYSGSSARSEFRDFVDNNDLPIEQTTSLGRVPLSANAKFYLASRGRSIGRYAWIPTKFAPFIGAGGGAMWYRFKQVGDFINFETFDVFPDAFESSGWTPTANGFGGVDISLGPRFGFTAEGRYTWAKATLSSDFDGFERIDLSGYNGTLGFYVRF
ncbi:MAG: hypothetical protein ACT4P6_03245 [Gemmatimonadaceae bacterium]